MMLNSVDLPQPDGPMTARNSPGATVNDMRSTATTGPSAVSKRFDTSSTTRMASAGVAATAARSPEVAVVTCVPSCVMPGLVPGIHVFLACGEDVDGRDEP